MEKEIDEKQLEEADEKKKKKILGMKRVPINHISADDIEFDDPEYLEARKREEIASKRKGEAEIEKRQNDLEHINEKSEKTEEDEKDEEDKEEKNDESEDESLNESEVELFKGDKWIGEFESICLKMSKKSIKINEFEKMLDKIIASLDPGKNELNKDRIFSLTKKLVTYYQSLFQFKSPSKLVIDNDLVNLLTKYIYDLTFKYGNKSTKKDPSKYVALFKEILSGINSSYLNLKPSERRFPQLDIVSH